MTDEPSITTRREFKGLINYEAILGGHLNRVLAFRDLDPRRYASSVESFAIACPPVIAQDCLKHLVTLGLDRCVYDTITKERMLLYDTLLLYINNELAKAGLIFKTSTWDVGVEDR